MSDWVILSEKTGVNMITKAHLKQLIDEYEKARSLVNVGFFLYVTDYTTSTTQFYYALRLFYNKELMSLKLTDPLSNHSVKKLALIIHENEATPNSTNHEILELYDAVSALVNSENTQLRNIR